MTLPRAHRSSDRPDESPLRAGAPEHARALLVDSPAFDLHAPAGYHPERPERLLAARRAMSRVATEWTTIAPRQATLDELERVHHPEFLERFVAMRGEQAQLDADTYVAKGSVDAALVAAGSLIAMVDAMLDGPTAKGVALLRPPGHHARAGQSMGFCLLNNVAVAAAHARSRGLSRVAVVDWDVHHGNGTQEIFWHDPAVLYLSLHQHPFYPGTGSHTERGAGDGEGYTVNVPLSAGGDDAIYHGAFERIVLPVLSDYAPDLILVSAGFDAAIRDPLADMRLSGAAFAYMAAELAKLAATASNGRMALVLEGGYDLTALEDGLAQATRGMLTGRAPEIPRLVDHPDLAAAARAAHETFRLIT